MFIFPAIKSDNEAIKILLNYTINNQDIYNYEYHIIIHNYDKDLWDDIKNSNNSHFIFYSFGDSKEYSNLIDENSKNINLEILNFNQQMMFVYKEFLESKIINKIKYIIFDAIATNIPSFIHVLLQNELKINTKIYISPSPLPQIFWKNYELNLNAIPFLNEKYTDKMNFKEKLFNNINYYWYNILFEFIQMQQYKFFISNGYEEISNKIIFPDAMHFIQYPIGLGFPLSLPPNFILLNTITAQNEENLLSINSDDSNELNIFLSKYKYNIYVNDGLLSSNYIDRKSKVKLFEYLKAHKDFGFIVYSKENINDIKKLNIIPKNVLIKENINRNNLFADKRISVVITFGDINSICESIYHEKPMIVIGINNYKLNCASFVERNKLGIAIYDNENMNYEFLVWALNELINNKEYENNAIKMSKILKNLKNSKEEFKYWLDFGFKNSYESRFVNLYLNGKLFIMRGYDTLIFIILFIFVVIFIIYICYRIIHRCLCGQCEPKKKKKRMKVD